MTEKQLIKQLHRIQDIKPDEKWVQDSREFLLSQISNNTSPVLVSRSIISSIKIFLRTAAQPAFALAVFVFILVGASLFSHQLFNKAKPNDSLYIARVISEKAKLSTMFNKDDRNKLEAEFANSHAQDIASVLAKTDDQVEVAKLSKEFKKEIDVVKTRVNKTSNKDISPVKAKVDTSNDSDVIISIADSSKDSNGIEIKENKKDEKKDLKQEEGKENLDNNTSILKEVEMSFENKDYSAVVDKLQQIEVK